MLRGHECFGSGRWVWLRGGRRFIRGRDSPGWSLRSTRKVEANDGALNSVGAGATRVSPFDLSRCGGSCLAPAEALQVVMRPRPRTEIGLSLIREVRHGARKGAMYVAGSRSCRNGPLPGLFRDRQRLFAGISHQIELRDDVERHEREAGGSEGSSPSRPARARRFIQASASVSFSIRNSLQP